MAYIISRRKVTPTVSFETSETRDASVRICVTWMTLANICLLFANAWDSSRVSVTRWFFGLFFPTRMAMSGFLVETDGRPRYHCSRSSGVGAENAPIDCTFSVIEEVPCAFIVDPSNSTWDNKHALLLADIYAVQKTGACEICVHLYWS